MLKEHDPLLYNQLRDDNVANERVMEGAINDMINDQFMEKGDEDPCAHFNSKDGDEIYHKVKEEAQFPIYKGAKMSKLSATLLLLNLQTMYGWGDNYVDALLRLVNLCVYIIIYCFDIIKRN